MYMVFDMDISVTQFYIIGGKSKLCIIRRISSMLCSAFAFFVSTCFIFNQLPIRRCHRYAVNRFNPSVSENICVV